ncbi:MAG: 16S rRNA (guanine1207-N2)-methyltransferase [Paracoccaceae bacterium]|jgi:16S rRNA (guanine1207-N2)-methyltransferase
MGDTRLTLAFEAGAVSLPQDGEIIVLCPHLDADMSVFPTDRLSIVQGFAPDHAVWQQRGFSVFTDVPERRFACAVVTLPRAKAQAHAMLAAAAGLGGSVIVDGAKTDGVDSIYKALRELVPVSGAFSKAHGKVFQIAPTDVLDVWSMPDMQLIEGGWTTAPGVFSADAPDKGSLALADALPRIKGRVADLGAGWGYLSARVLAQSDAVKEISLVEADWAALEASRHNVTDPRATFHWADATTWAGGRFDHVICNPPFHTERRADPALGAAFIASAARLLAPSGSLWLVANRHLPYERSLRAAFTEVTELPGPAAFKLFCARKPARAPRS